MFAVVMVGRLLEAMLGNFLCGLHLGLKEGQRAVNDALAPLGTMAREVPASPQRVWQLLREHADQLQTGEAVRRQET